MTIDGRARTAAATAKRTRTKHERWIAELAGAGWSVIQASHITVGAAQVYGDDTRLYVDCERCQSRVGEWDRELNYSEVPLPQVLHAVSGHTCTPEEKS